MLLTVVVGRALLGDEDSLLSCSGGFLFGGWELMKSEVTIGNHFQSYLTMHA